MAKISQVFDSEHASEPESQNYPPVQSWVRTCSTTDSNSADPNLKDYITTNIFKVIVSRYAPHSPTAQERRILQDYIDMCRRQHSQLTRNMSDAQRRSRPGSLARLTSARIIVRRKIDRCTIALSPGPIRRLPPEILGEIFVYCLWPFRPPHSSAAPLLLCQINSLWRDISSTTSSLWNRLVFMPQGDHELTGFLYREFWINERRISPLDNWLTHSRPSQLRFYFHEPNAGMVKYLVSAALLPNVGETKYLELRLPRGVSRTALQPFFALPPNSMHCLKYLIMAGDVPYDSSTTVFQSSSALTHLSISHLEQVVDSYVAGDVPTLKPVFPWGALTHLVITRHIEPEEWTSVLSTCSSLEVGLFLVDLRHGSRLAHDQNDDEDSHRCGYGDIPVLTSPIVQDKLMELDVDLVCGKWLSLDNLHFPALNGIRIRRSHWPASLEPLVPLNDFSWRNSLTFLLKSTQLRTLSLVGDLGSVEEIKVLLKHTPSVDCLDLNLNIDYTALLHALTLPKSSRENHTLLPLLEYLRMRLEGRDIPYISADLVRDMVLSRSPGVLGNPYLRHLTFSLSSRRIECFKNICQEVGSACPHTRTEVEVVLFCSRFVMPARPSVSWDV